MHLRGVCIVDSAQHLTLHVNLLCSSRARREYLGGFGQASADDIILICCKRPLWPTVLGIKEGPTALSIKENVSGAARVLVATGHWVCRYQMYATTQSWKVSMVNESAAEKGGYRECILQVQSSPCCLPFCAVPSSFGPQLQRILALHALSRHSADLAGAADIRRLEWLRQHDHVSCMLSAVLFSKRRRLLNNHSGHESGIGLKYCRFLHTTGGRTERIQQAQVRVWRASRAARAGDGEQRPGTHVDGHRRRHAGGR